ncbi:deoxyribose-phosphate aldolase [Neotamlana laminarinivorans]|uniref:Deoxyribose-phosphate aldolase n=1 Tax=Neotamlana laminarinivorans TaxID=2883124 RepID=A0A9X1HWT1_9FLAO|nr:deoxyribose-phosphate aldolase [Tamlana laminarinivorans]MCB4797320.1 deoxyribose-phosphate aldolase [Tamlana laminarinivorans]
MDLNKFIDHTLLKPTATKEDIITLCNEAKTHQFFSVCVNSCYVQLAKKQLENTNVKVCSVIGFPLGAMSTHAKVEETKDAIKNGADEIDMVINIGLIKSNDFDAVAQDIKAVKTIMPNTILKVILETCYLTDSEIIQASEISINNGADFIKTSTGFGTAGATLHHVKLMKQITGNKAKVKASGGIKNAETAVAFINLGAERLGTSSGIAIISGETSNSNY